MSDKQAEENVARTIYKRADEYLVLKHILIPFQSRQCVTKDTLAPFKKAMEIYGKIADGMNFDSVSVQYARSSQAGNREENGREGLERGTSDIGVGLLRDMVTEGRAAEEKGAEGSGMEQKGIEGGRREASRIDAA